MRLKELYYPILGLFPFSLCFQHRPGMRVYGGIADGVEGIYIYIYISIYVFNTTILFFLFLSHLNLSNDL